MNHQFKHQARGPLLVQVRGTLEMTGPWHVGTGQTLSIATDAPLLRCESSGNVFLPGASLRGVLRSYLLQEAIPLGCDMDSLERFFGTTPNADVEAGSEDDRDCQGRLTIFDAQPISAGLALPGNEHGGGIEAPLEADPTAGQAAGPKLQVRDHVRIDREFGAAMDGLKFDSETAGPACLAFEMRYEGNSLDDPELRLLVAAVDALENGKLSFGGKSAWGHGRGLLRNTQWILCDRSTSTGLDNYLRSRFPPGLNPIPLLPESFSPRPRALDGQELMETQARLRSDARELEQRGARTNVFYRGVPELENRLNLELRIRFDGPALVAGVQATGNTNEAEKNADAVFFRAEDGRYSFPGSSIRGVLRTECERIERLTNPEAGAETPWVQSLFGDTDTRHAAGRIRFFDAAVSEPKAVILDHVAIDRLTGFAADAKLFQEYVLVSPEIVSTLEVRWFPGEEAHRSGLRLLFQALRELSAGWLWFGGRTSRGCGHAASAYVDRAIVSRLVQTPEEPIRRKEVVLARSKARAVGLRDVAAACGLI